MITRRDIAIAVVAVCTTLGAGALAQQRPANFIGPSVYDWTKMTATKTDVGEVRQVMRGPTATLDELEFHITTLNPGRTSHAPHTHENEELVIIREGTVEVLNDGTWKRLGPGSVIFNASNPPHALNNVGDTPTTYWVINWASPGKGKVQ